MKKIFTSVAVASAIVTTNLAASSSEIEDLKAEIAELRKNTELLIEETADIKSGSFGYTVVDKDKTINGLGDAASKVYYSKSPLSIGGYGEMYYADADNAPGKTDIYRFVPYIGYKFSDNIILNTELEFEHSGEEIAVEFMYIDFLLSETYNIRLGHLLVPMGLVNIRHEPTLFNTVQRPDVERYLIPSTWHETGVLLYGDISDIGLHYTVGLVNALDLKNDGTDSGWIRNGRIKGTGIMNSLAGVARVDYTGINGLFVGASAYYGNAAQGDTSESNAFIYDIHATYENGGLKLRGLYTATSVEDAENWDEPAAATDASGYYLNAEYDLLSFVSSTQKLPFFVQYESYNTTEKVVSATAPNNETEITTVGLNYFPHDQVVLKLDYAMKDFDDAAKTDSDTVSLGLGFIF